MSEEKILKNILSYLKEKKEKEMFEKAGSFHKKRIKKIEKNEVSIPLGDGAKVVLHLIPLNSSYSQEHYFLSQAQLKTLRDLSTSQTYNFDGVLHFHQKSDNTSSGYIQLFTDGTIESVGVYSSIPARWSSKMKLPIYKIEKDVVNRFEEYISFLKNEFDIGLPILVYFTLVGAKDYLIEIEEREPDVLNGLHNFGRDILDFPYLLINNFDIVPTKILKTIFDRLWNSSGYPRSFHYDKDGNWKEE